MRLARAALALLITLAFALWAPAARAQGDRERANALFAEAQRADRDLRFAEALVAYRAALEADPSAPTAPRARSRAAWIGARAEGGMAPLVALERLRQSAELQRDRAEVDRLAAAADGFPAGLVRSEARLLCAGLYAGSFGDPRRALPLLDAVADDESADPLTRRLGVSEKIRARRATGDLAGAVADVERWGALAGPALSSEVRREARRVWIRAAASGLLGLLAIAGLLSAIRLGRRIGAGATARCAVRPVMVAFAFYVAAAGGALAHAYDGTTPKPFLLLAAGVLGLGAVGRLWSRASSPRQAWLRAPACAAGVLAVAFLALDRTDAAFLDAFGL